MKRNSIQAKNSARYADSACWCRAALRSVFTAWGMLARRECRNRSFEFRVSGFENSGHLKLEPETFFSHNQFVGAADYGMLHLLKIVFYHVERIYAAFEVAREAGEKRSDLGILEVLELGNDVVALLPGLHPVNKILQALPAKPQMVDALREHAGKKEGEIADVLTDLTFAIERRRRAVYWVGFQQHLAHVVQRTIPGVLNLEQLVRFAELGQQVRDIGHDLRIANANFVCVVLPHQVFKELLQRMRFRNHNWLNPLSLAP